MADIARESLHRSLALLRAELARAAALDAPRRQRLQAALAEIEAQIGAGDASPAAQAAPHRLESLAVGFEADHPLLAASVRQIIGLLEQAGL
jgi:hypothetical protein